MKTRGIQNAINRLIGAHRLGSPTLLAQAEREAIHALTQARAWMARSASATGEVDERHADIAAITLKLEQMLDKTGID